MIKWKYQQQQPRMYKIIKNFNLISILFHFNFYKKIYQFPFQFAFSFALYNIWWFSVGTVHWSVSKDDDECACEWVNYSPRLWIFLIIILTLYSY